MRNGRTCGMNSATDMTVACSRYGSFQKIWDRMEPFVDNDRFRHVQSRLKIQSRDAVWWKDACLLYFQTFSGRPFLTTLSGRCMNWKS